MKNKILIFLSTLLIFTTSIFFISCGKKTYTVTFCSNGGNKIASITQEADHIIILESPSKKGYTFDGWYLDEQFTNKFTTNTMPKDNITLYAKWNINQYKVEFNSNGGSEVETIIQDYDTNVSKPTDPIKEGYTFKGWYSDEQLNNSYEFNKIIDTDIKLYAKWDVNQYNIVFNSNGGSEVKNITQDYNTSVEKPSNPTKTGYTFAGWYIDESFSNEYEFTTMPSKNIELYAKWNVLINYTKDINGGYIVLGTEDKNVTEIEIPLTYNDEPVIAIGNNAFNNCINLVKVKIPNSIKRIDINAFNGCTNLQYNTYDNGLYLGNDENEYLVLVKGKINTIKSCEIHNSTKIINEKAFLEYVNLESVIIPSNLEVIGNSAFEGCKKLTGITLGNKLTTIGDRAFYNCVKLGEVKVPDSVTSLGKDVFKNDDDDWTDFY